MKRWLCLLVFGFFFFSTPVWAYTVGFGDTTIYWPSWGNGTSDDSKDVIGHPDLTGGEVEINNDGTLSRITFTFETWQSGWSYEFTDLFLDIDADETWDYIVKLYTGFHGATSPGNYDFLDIRPLNLSVTDHSLPLKYALSHWPSSGYRENHPIALANRFADSGIYLGRVYFGGVSAGDTSTYFDFSSLSTPITLGSEFTIGWTVQCANDVIYETIKNPVPEPASMLLVGAGLVVVVGLYRRRK